MNVPIPHRLFRLSFFIAATAISAVGQSLAVAETAPIGTPLVFTLNTGAPSTDYLLDFGFRGTSPGVPLPITNRIVPVNRPWAYLDLGGINHPSVFSNFHGTTDANGRATAVLHVPNLPTLVGLTFHAFYVTENPASPDGVGQIVASTPVAIIGNSGWTNFTPSADTRVVYVSTSGNDANSGLSPQQAVRSVARGKSLVRHGFPDWLLFRRGDVFNETIGSWQKCGRSASERMLIGSYGTTGARPVFRAGSGHGISFTGGGGSPTSMNHVALSGLDFWADARDPASPTFAAGAAVDSRGLLFLRPGQNLLVEDCVFRFFGTNMVIQGEGSGLHGLTLRRCQLVDAYGIAGSYHSQGFYMHNGHQVVIEENLFDHNGWHGGPAGSHATIFSHNLYIHWDNSNVTVRRNIIARGGSHGLQLRSGGTVSDNVFVRNPIAVLLGGDYNPHPSNPTNLVSGNVIMQGTNISASEQRGWGMEIKRVANPVVRDNLFSRCEGGMAVGIQLTELASCTVANNTLWSWNGGNLANNSGFAIHHDILSQAPAFGSCILANSVPFADTSRTVASYHAALGGAASVEAFLASARQQSRHWWRPAFTAGPLRGYLRAGFRPTTNLGSPQIGAVPY